MNSLVALPIAGALSIPSLAAANVDPIFALIETHQKAYEAFIAAESARILVDRDLEAAGDLFSQVISRGNPLSGLPNRPISKTHADIDMYSPADIYPEDNKREHDELSAAEARRDARLLPSQKAMDDAWDADRQALDTLVETVPATMAGVMALLNVQRELFDAGDEMLMDAWHSAAICCVVEEALLKLQAS